MANGSWRKLLQGRELINKLNTSWELLCVCTKLRACMYVSHLVLKMMLWNRYVLSQMSYKKTEVKKFFFAHDGRFFRSSTGI